MNGWEQAEFGQSLEAALSWMRAAQERLRLSDNTQGPRDALESRLRETEEIRESEHEGRLKVDIALEAADPLLQNGNDDIKQDTHAKLKELKAMWEETSTYIIHCHSRIEWVWLHWGEYLKAHEEFGLWLSRMHCMLEPQLELQLDAREKLWQLDHHRVILSDVQGQAVLLERLLDEALALHGRTEDPSVGPKALQELQGAYDEIRNKAQERVAQLEKIAEDHQTYSRCVQEFQAWLDSKTEELNHCLGGENSASNKLHALQDLYESVTNEEDTVLHLEARAEAVKAKTSPAGAEVVTKEAEHLRELWDCLRQHLLREHEALHAIQLSADDCKARVLRLRADASQLHKLLQGLSRDLEAKGGERTEEEMVAMWRKFVNVRSSLAAEEPLVEELKSQLKDLFRCSQDAGPVSEEVLAVVKEYQGVKSRASKLSAEAEADLRQVLQDPLRGYRQWATLATQVLEASAEASEFSHLALVVQKMEKLLKQSLQLQERLSLLQVKGDLLSSVFSAEKAASTLAELGTAVKEREHLHSQLVQKKSHLQDFGDMCDSTCKRLLLIKERLKAAAELQPDILAKKSQYDQLMIVKKDLEDCEAHITALETLVSSSISNRRRFDQLYAEWRDLYKDVRLKVSESEQNITEHENFHESLLSVEKWLMIMRQKLESFCSSAGEWSIENRRTEAERALGEFPERELQLHRTEAQGQKVLLHTSEDGKVHIVRDLQRLRESWMSLHALSLNIYRLLSGNEAAGSRDVPGEMEGPTGTGRVFSAAEGKDQITMSASDPIPGDYSGGKSSMETQYQADPKLKREFEVWLKAENSKLCKILGQKGQLSSKELKARDEGLKNLQSHVAWGQNLFQKLLASQGVGNEDEEQDLEELRYRWMLYKSQLKDAVDLNARLRQTDAGVVREEPMKLRKKRSTFLSRVCWAALPLQLLLLALLLLAFLLPLTDEGASCSLANNFARSFSVMLRYNGPPPT
ncbi:nesprin-3-like [Scleropages formosus]|uniref:Nesprin-3-like n=1 Tax=Scleropages formosus TaxID=113540 RepID=A0A0P7UDC1_SCLFO|nr:nesprin-3-like [Scleropages formosus]